MLQVQAASYPYTAACTFSIPSPETANLDLAMLFFLSVFEILMGSKYAWVALVCTFFDHQMQVITDVQLRWPQLG